MAVDFYAVSLWKNFGNWNKYCVPYVLMSFDLSRTVFHFGERLLKYKGKTSISKKEILNVNMIIFQSSSLWSPKYEIKLGFCV